MLKRDSTERTSVQSDSDGNQPEGFAHYKQSVRVAQVLEKDGEGLNLTWEVVDGILNHRTSGRPATLEGQVVRFSDKIAYIHHDMDDAQRAGIITEDDIPITLRMLLGYTTRERLNTFVHDIIENSMDQDHIQMSEEIQEAMSALRSIMFQDVYTNPVAKKEEQKADKMLSELYEYYLEHPETMSKEYRELVLNKGINPNQAVCDYISGMTDQYSMEKFREIFIPKAWEVY
jgi:dGTPase